MSEWLKAYAKGFLVAAAIASAFVMCWGLAMLFSEHRMEAASDFQSSVLERLDSLKRRDVVTFHEVVQAGVPVRWVELLPGQELVVTDIQTLRADGELSLRLLMDKVNAGNFDLPLDLSLVSGVLVRPPTPLQGVIRVGVSGSGEAEMLLTGYVQEQP